MPGDGEAAFFKVAQMMAKDSIFELTVRKHEKLSPSLRVFVFFRLLSTLGSR